MALWHCREKKKKRELKEKWFESPGHQLVILLACNSGYCSRHLHVWKEVKY